MINKNKTKLTLLVLTTLLMTMIPMASANPDNYLWVGGFPHSVSTATWLNRGEDAKFGDWVAHLDTKDAESNEAGVIITMPTGFTLGDLDTLSWSVFTVSGYPAHVDIILADDIDGLSNIDSLTAELASNVESYTPIPTGYTYGTWLETFEGFTDGPNAVDDSTTLWVTRHGAGTTDAPYGTLAELKAGTVTSPDSNDPVITIDEDTVILRLEIEVDEWSDRDGGASSEAYIDDILVNGVTYSLEPVALDAEFYQSGDTVTVTVIDIYENDGSTSLDLVYPINVKSTTMTTGIDIVVKETGVNTGIFTGTFKLVDYTPGTGELLAGDGDTITVTYDTLVVTAKIDDTAPVVEITDPVDLDFVKGSVSIEATAHDTNAITVVLEIDEEEVDWDSDYLYNWDTTATEGTDPVVALWPDGAYTITVTATDLIGHTASDSISVTVDNTVPEIANALGSPTTVLPATAETFVFTVEPTDAGSGIDTVTIDLGELGGGASVSMLDDGVDPDVTADDGVYTVSYDSTGVADGSHEVTITVTDEMANSLVSDPIIIVSSTDLVKPVITGESITYPVGVVSARLGDPVVISATITDAEGIASVVVTDTEDVVITTAEVIVDDTYTLTIASLTGFETGSHVLTITAADNNANEETATVTLEVTTEISGLTVDLEEGWNMFSLPLIPDDSSIEVVLADVMENVEIVWGYKNGVWSSYLPALPEFSTLTEMVDGNGYWVKMTADDTVTVSGVELPGPGILPPVYEVDEGWNLIGFKSVDTMSINGYLTTVPSLVLESSVSYGWDATTQDYELTSVGTPTVEMFMPGQAYWLYLTEAANIAPPTEDIDPSV